MNNEVAEVVVVESIVKAILGFLNAEGGKLLAGVADDGSVIGLEADIKHTGRSKDQLLRYIVDKLNSYIGQSITFTLSINWHDVDGKEILVFEVPQSATPVFPTRKVDGKQDLFVRQNANVIPLAGAELYSYVTRRFDNRK
jgi:predicted HTH transcriptional regulator